MTVTHSRPLLRWRNSKKLHIRSFSSSCSHVEALEQRALPPREALQRGVELLQDV